MKECEEKSGAREALSIVHVLDTLAGYDRHRAVVELSETLSRRGHEVTILVLSPPLSDLSNRCRGATLAGPIARAPSDFSLPWKLAAAIRRLRPDIVHAHGPIAGLVASLGRAMHLWRGRLIYTNHDVYSMPAPAYTRLSYPVIVRQADWIVCIHQVAAHSLVDAYPKRLATHTVIHYGIDTAAIRPSRSRSQVRCDMGLEMYQPVIVSAGILHEQSNPIALCQATAIVAREVEMVQLVLALRHENPQVLDQLNEAISEFHIDANIQFAPPNYPALDLIAAADVFALCSHWETIPYELLWAMALGIVPVASAVGGIPEVIEHQRSGFLTSREDIEEIALALRQAIATAHRAEMQETMRTRIEEHFRSDTAAEAHEMVYRKVLNR